MKKILLSSLLLTFCFSFGQTLPFYEGFNYSPAGTKLIGYSTTSLVGTTGLGGWTAVANPTPLDLLAPNLTSSTPYPGAAGVISGWGSGPTDISSGITHTTGDATAWTPTKSLKGVVGQYFEVSYTISNRTTGSIGITFGSTTVAPTGITASGNYNFISNDATTSKKLSILPTLDFNGTLILSIKQNGLSVDDVLIAESPAWTASGLPATTGKSIGFVGSGVDPELLFNNQTSGKVYSSFIFKVTADASTTTATGFYSFMSLGSSNENFYSASVMIRNSGTGTFNLGLSKTNSITECVWNTTNFTLNQEIFVVISYENIGDAVGTNQIANLWINPTVNSTEPAVTLFQSSPTTDVSRTNIDRIKILQASSGSTPTIILDEIRVANTWGDVTSTTLALGTTTFNSISNLSIYPNPVTNGKLFISSSSNLEKEVVIFTTLGQQVLQDKTVSEAINVAALSQGTYFVRITEEGLTTTKKLIIK